MDIVRTVEHIEATSGVRWWLIAILLLASTAFPVLLALEIIALGVLAALQPIEPIDAGGDA